MGGIVVAVGGGAERAVRRGAEPLLRRPWHSLSMWCGPRVAVGFCGEHGGVTEALGVVVALDGELLIEDRVASNDEAMFHVLRSYRRSGHELRGLSGQFAAVVWDSATDELLLVVDQLGRRPLYLARDDGVVLAASELKALVAAGIQPRLDLDGAAQLLSYEHLLGATTPLAGAELLSAASTTVISATGRATVDRGRHRVNPSTGVGPEDPIGDFATLLEAAIVRRRDDPTALALSGGLDSRCLASIVGRRWPGSRAFTFAAPRSEELRNAKRVAKASVLDHHLLELERGYVARAAAETVWLSEGLIRCFHSHHLALRQVRARFGVPSLLMGFTGEIVRGGALALTIVPPSGSSIDALVDAAHRKATVAIGDELLDRLLRPRFANDLRGRARASLQDIFEGLDGPPLHRFLDYYINDVYRRKILPGVELFADDVVHRDPYGDDDLLDFVARLPMKLRTELKLQPAFLRRTPALARVPNTKDGIAPAHTGWREGAVRHAVRVRRGVRKRLDHPLRRVGLPAQSGYSDYASHLQDREGARALGLLLEDRTLDRGQIREKAVRELVDETLAGSGRHTQALGVLLTLELFQRQFIDGDGMDGPR